MQIPAAMAIEIIVGVISAVIQIMINAPVAPLDPKKRRSVRTAICTAG